MCQQQIDDKGEKMEKDGACLVCGKPLKFFPEERGMICAFLCALISFSLPILILWNGLWGYAGIPQQMV